MAKTKQESHADDWRLIATRYLVCRQLQILEVGRRTRKTKINCYYLTFIPKHRIYNSLFIQIYTHIYIYITYIKYMSMSDFYILK